MDQILEARKIFILRDNPLPDEEQNEHGIGNSGRQIHRLTAGLHSCMDKPGGRASTIEML